MPIAFQHSRLQPKPHHPLPGRSDRDGKLEDSDRLVNPSAEQLPANVAQLCDDGIPMCIHLESREVAAPPPCSVVQARTTSTNSLQLSVRVSLSSLKGPSETVNVCLPAARAQSSGVKAHALPMPCCRRFLIKRF